MITDKDDPWDLPRFDANPFEPPAPPIPPTPEEDIASANALIDGTAKLFGAPDAAPLPTPAIDFAPARDLLARDRERIKAIATAPDPLAEQERRRTNLDKAIEGFADLALRAPKPEDASWATRRAESFARAGELAGHLPPGGAEQRIQKLYDRIDHGHAERVLKRDPAELQTMLADATMFSGLAPENRNQLLARAAARVESAPLDQARDSERAALDAQIARAFAREARAVELAGATPSDIAEAAAKGEITPALQTRLMQRAREAARVEREETRAITRMADLRVRGYDRDDPDHRAMAQTYAARAVKAWGRMSPAQFAAQLGGFIKDTGDVPPSVDRAIRVAFARGSPGYQAETSDALMRLKDRPDVLARVDALALLQATANHALRRNGAKPEEAATQSFEVLRGGGEGFRGANDRHAVTRAVDALYRTLPEAAQKSLREALPLPMPNALLGPLDWNRLLTPVTHREPAPMESPAPAQQPVAPETPPRGDRVRLDDDTMQGSSGEGTPPESNDPDMDALRIAQRRELEAGQRYMRSRSEGRPEAEQQAALQTFNEAQRAFDAIRDRIDRRQHEAPLELRPETTRAYEGFRDAVRRHREAIQEGLSGQETRDRAREVLNQRTALDRAIADERRRDGLTPNQRERLLGPQESRNRELQSPAQLSQGLRDAISEHNRAIEARVTAEVNRVPGEEVERLRRAEAQADARVRALAGQEPNLPRGAVLASVRNAYRDQAPAQARHRATAEQERFDRDLQGAPEELQAMIALHLATRMRWSHARQNNLPTARDLQGELNELGRVIGAAIGEMRGDGRLTQPQADAWRRLMQAQIAEPSDVPIRSTDAPPLGDTYDDPRFAVPLAGLLEGSLYSDPWRRARAYARYLGIPETDMRIVEDETIVYRQDGRWYRTVPSALGGGEISPQRLLQYLAADGASNLVGFFAPSGTGGMRIGAAIARTAARAFGFEFVRQQIANHREGTPWSRVDVENLFGQVAANTGGVGANFGLFAGLAQSPWFARLPQATQQRIRELVIEWSPGGTIAGAGYNLTLRPDLPSIRDPRTGRAVLPRNGE